MWSFWSVTIFWSVFFFHFRVLNFKSKSVKICGNIGKMHYLFDASQNEAVRDTIKASCNVLKVQFTQNWKFSKYFHRALKLLFSVKVKSTTTKTGALYISSLLKVTIVLCDKKLKHTVKMSDSVSKFIHLCVNCILKILLDEF